MTPAIGRAANAAVERAAARVADGLRAVPGARVTVSGGDITIAGHGLALRIMSEPALRWPAEAMR